MGVLGVDFDKGYLDDDNNFYKDDPETIIHVRVLLVVINLKNTNHLKNYEHRINVCWCISDKEKKRNRFNFYW